MRLAVAGGTGTVGRHVVEVARHAGHDVVVLTRSEGVDLVSGSGLVDRLAGADAVVDVTNVVTQRRAVALRFFAGVTGRLLEAGAAAGVGHHVLLSIVGVDRVPTGYYQAKVAQEEQVAAGPVPWSVLRATQFHEFAQQALGFACVGPISFVPRMIIRPAAAREVAEALVDLAEVGPSSRVPDLAGPEEHELVDLAHAVGARDGRRVVGLPLPGRSGRAMRSGALCPDRAGPRGTTTFDQWLVEARE